MLVKNVYTSIDADVVEIVDKVRKLYGLSFRQLVNSAIRYYWENELSKDKTEDTTEEQPQVKQKKAQKKKGG
jgi:hypothetical protein